MTERFLLYIDILGFSALIDEAPAKIDDLYEVIASLHVHSHSSFRVIIFSDTIVVYNTEGDACEDRSYLIMFLCEFAKDLQLRLTGRGIFFRAVLTCGQFRHYELNGIPCFFGTALVRAYRTEKAIPAIGLFIERSLVRDSDIFQRAPFGREHNFVFITQSLNTLEDLWGGVIDRFELEGTDLIHTLVPELLLLRDISRLAELHPDERVKLKHLNTLNLLRTRYPKTIGLLEANAFQFDVLCPGATWASVAARYPEPCDWAVKTRVSY